MPEGVKTVRLKKRHELFLTHYLDCFDTGLAAERAGYGAWYGEHQLAGVGRRILRRQDVADALEERLMASLRGHGMSRGRILKEITRLATFDIRKLYNNEGRLLEPHELDDDTAAAVASIEVEARREGRGEDAEEYNIHKIKLGGKTEALKMLGQHLQLFGDDNKVKLVGADGGPPAITVEFVKPGEENK
jgi:phage terminase small subunit